MKKIEVSPTLIPLLEKKVKYIYERCYKRKYNGLFSVSEWLLNYYYTVYYPHRDSEFEYLSFLKMELLWLEVAQILVSNKDNYFKHNKVNMEELFEQADEEITDIKKRIYNLWKNSKLARELELVEEKLKQKESHRLRLYHKMLQNLVALYPKFKLGENHNFKGDIGLC